MDGLMVDSEPLSRRAWDEYLRPYNQIISDDLQSRIIGLRGDQSSVLIREAFNLPKPADAILEERRLIYQQLRAQGVPVMPGLMELHAIIAARQIPWAVATSSPRDHAEEILAQLGLADAVGAIAAGNEVQHGKPAPDIYLLAAQRLGVPPQKCLALEDSGPGSRAAVAAGMLTVAIPNGETNSADFSHAHYVYTSLFDVIENLDRLLLE
jgi:HAD superfamily hydrolase (TIGR01509 family)